MYQQKHIKKSSFIICCILILNLLVSTMPVFAAGDTIVLNGPDESAISEVFKRNITYSCVDGGWDKINMR